MRIFAGLILIVGFFYPLKIYSQYKSGAESTNQYFPLLSQYRSIGVVAHAASKVGKQHLVDTLLKAGLNVKVVFAPEHGFRGHVEAGMNVSDERDATSGLPIVSLYGKNKKPTPEQMRELDAMVFDLQDVGVRFYTYVSTLHYVMEACAETGIPLYLLDRPNPNGDYFDGPILEPAFRSFVGMHPIPVVYGMTLGELALMINGEGWLGQGKKCDLTVIPMEGYRHDLIIELPIKPSPNLPNLQSIRLYPSLCFFEATPISVGRGTDWPFQVIGAPNPQYGDFTFVPRSIPGAAAKPLHEGKTCYGMDLRNDSLHKRLTLYFLLEFFRRSPHPDLFITSPEFFDKLAGSSSLRKQLLAGWSETEIRKSWEVGLQNFANLRKPYLIYP
ncbi:MAG: exo-beta-N-acetylmuramidase NamZ family protein [Bacteroidales bacterium]